VDFALPEYDGDDFSADMEPAPDPRTINTAGEQHAEEISKILAETDVYVKYGLHQKAVDHLRRVFTLDPENVEAHERLKDIFISQGREQEAEVELLKLAELVAPGDPDRAEAYLQELLAMNGTHTGAFEIARRFRLRVARSGSVSSEVSYQIGDGGVAPVGDEMDDLDLAPSSAPRPVGISRGGRSKRDSVDDFDPNALINGPMAHGSPAPPRPLPVPPARTVPQMRREAFDDDFDPQMQSTRQMPPEQVDALTGLDDDDGIIVDRPPQGQRWDEHNAPTRFDAAANRALLDAVDRHLEEDVEDAPPSVDVPDEDLPFDPDEARAFDAAVHGKGNTDAVYVTGFEETGLPEQPDTSSYDNMSEDPLSVSGSYDPYGTEAVQTPPYDPTQNHAVDTSSAPQQARAESTVEDELDEADFYSGQGMYQEAMDVLRNLLSRYPGHRLATAKLREIEVIVGGGHLDQAIDAGDSIEQEMDAVDHSAGTDAIDLDEIEEIEDFEQIDSVVDQNPMPKKKRVPTVMLEKPVDEGDAETHYDLGLAYKEMGLHEEAIKAFEKVIRSPGREVQCRLMIGMCFRDLGNGSEAIHQFKQALHAEPSERERQSLYYEIGITYEAIGDYGEALYYFEMVTKRDPGFADAAARAEELRSRGTHSSPSLDDDI